MSWASHNPEKYDELIRQGIVAWFEERMRDAGFEIPGEWFQGYEALIEVMQQDPEMRGVYDECILRANGHIIRAQAEYFSEFIEPDEDGG